MKIIKVYDPQGTPYDIKVDDEDYPKLVKYPWIWRNGYAAMPHQRSFYQMHRMIMGALWKEEILIDHKDGDHQNCQRYNLRRANRFQNQQNRKTNEGNTLPKGIRQLPSGKYNVRVQAYNKRRVFGAFDTVEEAVEARNKAAQELHGEFYRPSHTLEENNV
jgi:hypothetical protein